MKRKAYLLLELLIAVSLLALCALPLVQSPMHLAREEIYAFEKMELERLAQVGFAEILEKFYQNAIPLKAFEETLLQETPFLKDSVSTALPGIFKRTFNREFFLWTRGQKEGTEQNEFRLVNIKITFTPVGRPKKFQRSFTYTVFLELKKGS